MEKVNYNKSTLDIIKNLSSLSKQLIFQKSDDGNHIVINSGDTSAMILYQLKAPLSHFSFIGDECAFFEYPDFHDLLSILDNCEIYQKDDILTLVSGSAKIKYLASEPELIKNYFEDIECGDIIGSFILDYEYLKKINKLKSSIRATSIKISINSNDITFNFFNKVSENTFEYVFNNDIDNISNKTYLISTEIFDKIPLANYKFSLSEDGLVRLKMISDDIDLHITTGELEDDI